MTGLKQNQYYQQCNKRPRNCAWKKTGWKSQVYLVKNQTEKWAKQKQIKTEQAFNPSVLN